MGEQRLLIAVILSTGAHYCIMTLTFAMRSHVRDKPYFPNHIFSILLRNHQHKKHALFGNQICLLTLRSVKNWLAQGDSCFSQTYVPKRVTFLMGRCLLNRGPDHV